MPTKRAMTPMEFKKFWHSTHFCGCYDNSIPLGSIRKTMRAIEENRHWTDPEKDTVLGFEFMTFMLYWLDAIRLTEHGCGIRGSWFTDKGKALLAFFNAHTEEEIEAMMDSDEWLAMDYPDGDDWEIKETP